MNIKELLSRPPTNIYPWSPPDAAYNEIRYGNQENQQGRNSQNVGPRDNRQGKGVRQGDGIQGQSGNNELDRAQRSGSGGSDGLPDGSAFVYRYVASDGHIHSVTLNSIQPVDRELTALVPN